MGKEAGEKEINLGIREIRRTNRGRGRTGEQWKRTKISKKMEK